MNEIIWQDVVGYEGLYQVSSRGLVKSLKRIVTRKNGVLLPIPEKIKQQSIDNLGYKCVRLHNQGKKQTWRIHQLVAYAFLGEPIGKEINHIDGNKQNNNIFNLQYVTRQENTQHAYDTGLTPRGDKRATSKLSADIVRAIRLRYKTEHSTKIAEDYGVSTATIYDVGEKRTWRWVA